jgi:hypothetical protein
MGDLMQPVTNPTVPAALQEGEHKPLMTRDRLRLYLNEQGFPIGESTFEKMCMPSRGEGPEVEAWWGDRLVYNPERSLEWARSRLSKTRKRRTSA